MGAKFKMSDWEDEYDEDGVAIQNPSIKSAQTEGKFPYDDRQKEHVFFGVRNGIRSGAPRDGWAGRSCEGTEYKSLRGGGEGRPFTWSTGRRTYGNEKSDSSPPVTLAVENASIGRVIGGFLKH